ncbi:protein of unknown function [Burkholderia multivorans]
MLIRHLAQTFSSKMMGWWAKFLFVRVGRGAECGRSFSTPQYERFVLPSSEVILAFRPRR